MRNLFVKITLISVVFGLNSCGTKPSSSHNEGLTQEQAIETPDPLQKYVDWHSELMSTSELECNELQQTENAPDQFPHLIKANAEAIKGLNALGFSINKKERTIYTGIEQPFMYFKKYSFKNTISGCLKLSEIEVIHPSPRFSRMTPAARLFSINKDKTKEVVLFFPKYFAVVKENGTIHFFGPSYDRDDRFDLDLKIEEYKDHPELKRSIVNLESGRHIEALNWVCKALGIELNTKQTNSFFSERPFYVTKKSIGGMTGSQSLHQLPIVSSYDHRIGFYKSPKVPREQRVYDGSEDHYLHARAAAEMISAFAKKFVPFNSQNSNLFMSVAYLIIDPNYIYEYLSYLKNYPEIKKMVLSSSIVDENNWDDISSEKAKALTDHILQRSAEIIQKQANEMRELLEEDQELQRYQIRLAHTIAETYIDIGKNNKALADMAESLGRGLKGLDGEWAENGKELERIATQKRRDNAERSKRFIESYKQTLEDIFHSQGYKDAYRFKSPIHQLDERAFKY